MIAPDEKTFAYLLGKPSAPKGGGWQEAVLAWKALQQDPVAGDKAEPDQTAGDAVGAGIEFGEGVARAGIGDAAAVRPALRGLKVAGPKGAQ